MTYREKHSDQNISLTLVRIRLFLSINLEAIHWKSWTLTDSPMTIKAI